MQDNLLQNQQQSASAPGRKASNLEKDNLAPASKSLNANGAAGFKPASSPLTEAFNSLGKTGNGAAVQLRKEELNAQMKSDAGSSSDGGISINSGGLPTSILGQMESAFSTSFSDVKVHANSSKATSMGALAYAQGNDVHFAPGQYNPNSTKGQELIGHELTHVVQQRQGRVKATTQAKGTPVNDDPNLEKEADEMGRRAVNNKSGGGKSDSLLAHVTQKKAIIKKTGEEKLDEIASQQAIYEFAAHHLAYQQEGSKVEGKAYSMLFSAGYNPDKILWYGVGHGGKCGFQAVLIPSRRSDKNPIVAIRGTVPGGDAEDLLTVYTDMDPQAVGTTQFNQNRALIETILKDAKGMVDVTGHSLGGAMAQHVAVNFPGKIGNVATFQSPGIDQASVNRFNRLPQDQKPKVVHHIVTGDIVDKAGDANLPGDVFEHDFGKHLDVRVLLNTLTTSIAELKTDIALFNQTVKDILAIIKPQLRLPISAFEDLHLLYQKIQLLLVIKNRIQQKVQALRSYLATTASTVGESHGTHVFGASRYNDMRADLGMEDKVMGENLRNNVEITHHTSYPHSDQRAVAEPLRQNAGKALQNIFRAYISVVQTYESTVKSYNNFKRGVGDAWNGFTQGVSDGMSAASERINRAWKWVTDW